MVMIAKIKGHSNKKLCVSESIAFEATVDNAKTSKVVPEDQIEYVYDVVGGKVTKVKGFAKPKRK